MNLQKWLTTVSTTDGSPVPSKHAWESEGARVCEKGLTGRRARPGKRVTAEVCVRLLLSEFPSKPSHGVDQLWTINSKALFGRRQKVTCSNHFPRYLEPAQNQVFSNDFAELVFVLTQSPGSMVFHLSSIKLCEFVCILIFWLWHTLIWLHSSWGLQAITTMAAAWQRPIKEDILKVYSCRLCSSSCCSKATKPSDSPLLPSAKEDVMVCGLCFTSGPGRRNLLLVLPTLYLQC